MNNATAIPVQCPLGPVLRDVPGLTLTATDRERLLHPRIGGVVLFAENYADPAQLKSLVDSIHALRDPALLVCVDQEGGRVQRFRDGFVRIPAMREFGRLFDEDRVQAHKLMTDAAFVLASELVAHNIDISFAPVLDLALTDNPAIGDRAFHADPMRVAELASEFVDALRAQGLPAVGKHFPGHGGVAADSHVQLPVDPRDLAQLQALDMVPYRQLISSGRLDAVMTAHIQFTAIDDAPPTFSSVWLQQQLRQSLGFNGVIFSDDLHMQGAVELHSGAGERGQAALNAGCDLLLICRDELAADAMCDHPLDIPAASAQRVERLVSFCRTNSDARQARAQQALVSDHWQDRVDGLARLVA